MAQHSTFRDTTLAPVLRLRATVRAMLGLTFGTPAQQAATVAHIRSIHDRVHGTLRQAVGPFPAGTPYTAHDPALLLWVHTTLVDTAVRLYDAMVSPLSTAARDAYCRESAPVATALGARASEVPQRWDDLAALVDAMLAGPRLTVGPDARLIARALLTSPVVRATGPMAWATRHLTTAWLPAPLRDQYGLPWSPSHARRAARLTGGLRQLRRLAPSFAARWPQR